MTLGASSRWAWRWIRAWDEFWSADFQDEWGRQFKSSTLRNPFQLPSFVNAWAKTVGVELGRVPCVGVGTDQDGRKAILLTGIDARKGTFVERRTLAPLGDAFACYTDPLVSGPSFRTEDVTGLWTSARQSSSAFCDQALFRFVSEWFVGGTSATDCNEANPVLDLPSGATLNDLLARCSQNHRGGLRRLMRRLDDKGVVTFWEADATSASKALAEFDGPFTEAYGNRWSDRPQGNMLEGPGVSAFLRRLLEIGISEGWCRFSALCVDGESIAWHLGLLLDNELYWLVPTHRPEFSAFGPGRVLLAKQIEWAIAQGWTRVHLLTGGHDYKMAWRPNNRTQYRLAWHSRTLRGGILSCYDQVREFARTRSSNT